MSNRAYSLLQLKSVSEDDRILEGIATSISPDRMEDVVEPRGAAFKLPLPFLWMHGKQQPAIGNVVRANVTDEGIQVRVQIEQDDQPGPLKDMLDLAWRSIQKGLVRGLSIGFRPLETPEPIKGTFGLRFKKWEWLELSAVTIPANQDASISLVKSLSAPGMTGTQTVKTVRKTPMTTNTEKNQSYEATRQAKMAEMDAIMDASDEKGQTLDAEQAEKYESLKAEIKDLDAHLVRMREREALNRATIKAVNGDSIEAASASRASYRSPVITVKSPLPPGIELTRAVMCKARSLFAMRKGVFIDAVELAKQEFPDYPRIQEYIKAAIPAGTTTHTAFAGPLVDPTNLTSEFIDFLRPGTILGKITGFTMVPFNVRVIAQTTGGNGYWVGEGAPKPLTGFSFQAFTHTYHKVAAISVITEELARFSSPSAESLVRNGVVRALIERLDIDFIDPAQAASAGVNPASVTNGLTPLSSAGTSADNIRTDIQNLIEQYLLNNQDVAGLVLVMPNTLALAASLLVNSLGQREFPDLTMNGGTLLGIPVVTSMYAANQSGSGNLVVAINAPDIFLSDDGQVTVDASGEASLEMLDNPTNNSATPTPTTSVSMWQTNSIALRAERFITWTKRRAQAVVFMDDVNWGSIGSPS